MADEENQVQVVIKFSNVYWSQFMDVRLPPIGATHTFESYGCPENERPVPDVFSTKVIDVETISSPFCESVYYVIHLDHRFVPDSLVDVLHNFGFEVSER
ncbi:hypothetical protein H6785_03810 [Candidatus Nomurabacteria bacterium]|nr:hypothetical protein [Candidatus Nomurabacteria bacterium]